MGTYLISRTIAGIYLLVEGICDYRYKKVSSYGAIVVIALGVILELINKDGMINFCMNISLGLVFLGASVLTKGKIGLGDGIVIIGIGLLMGFRPTLIMVLAGSFFSCIYSLFLLVFKKSKFTSTFPYVPFLVVAYLFVILLEVKGI